MGEVRLIRAKVSYLIKPINVLTHILVVFDPNGAKFLYGAIKEFIGSEAFTKCFFQLGPRGPIHFLHIEEPICGGVGKG